MTHSSWLPWAQALNHTMFESVTPDSHGEQMGLSPALGLLLPAFPTQGPAQHLAGGGRVTGSRAQRAEAPEAPWNPLTILSAPSRQSERPSYSLTSEFLENNNSQRLLSDHQCSHMLSL